MKNQLTKSFDVIPYNKEVKEAYFKLLKVTKNLLATIERHELRCALQRQDGTNIASGIKVHQFVNPLIFLSLEYHEDKQLRICWGVEQLSENNEYAHITSRFVRLLYKVTSSENTTVDIESCVNTSYIITSCSELYECIEDRMKHHTFMLIKHKPAALKRKQMKAVA